MKKTILTICTTLLLFAGIAQEVSPCATVEKQNEFVASLTPEQRMQYMQEKEAHKQAIQTYIANHPEAASSNHERGVISYTIPVVFHIIHAGGPENISNEQVEDCIRIMNEDYQKMNSDVSGVVSAFQPIVADIEVEFKLAKLDPNGNCTNGITRTFSNTTFSGDGGDQVDAVRNAHGTWPGDKYLNVFVADDIGGAAGYTRLPYSSSFGGAGMGNGIHVLQNYVGSIGTSSSYTSRTLTHEVGHWLDLPHTWGGSNTPAVASNCDDDDGVSDTPNTEGWTSCNLSGSTCGSLDNVQNYMDYSYCSKMFTEGQKTRMHAALESPTANRDNISSPANLAATGVNLSDVLCKADFQVDKRTVCPGTTVDFEDLSYDAPSDWNWTFAGGTPSSSTAQNPSITYNTPGTYEVTLSASDGTNSDTETKSTYITVLPQAAALPLVEGFEGYSSIPNATWSTENVNGAGFELKTGFGYTGNKCVKLANFGQSGGQVDALISSGYDLSSITDDVTLSYRYAYRRRSSSNYETLSVHITNNCGVSWAQRNTLAGNNLGTQTASSSWEPSGKSDWVTVHMTNITSSYWVDNFRFKFEFESDGGNNIYLDNINLYAGTEADDPLSVEENTLVQGLAIYPNPTEGATNVSFTVNAAQAVTVSLLNTVGQEIQTNVIQAKSGKNLVMMGTSDVEAGIYFVNVAVGSNNQVRRLVIQ